MLVDYGQPFGGPNPPASGATAVPNRKDRCIVPRIGAGDVFLPVGRAIAIGICIGGPERVGNCFRRCGDANCRKCRRSNWSRSDPTQ